MPPAYAIIVPAYNEEHQLAQTLPVMLQVMAGIDEQGELIVVDNNSTDQTAAVARDHGATVVFAPVNQIAKARNAGAAATDAPHLIFIDADTTPAAELLRDALDALATGTICGGGAQVVMDPRPGFAVRGVLGLWNFYSRLFKLPAGCFFFCERAGWEAVDGFSEAVYASEEIWFARKLKKWGKPQNKTLIILPGSITTSNRKTDNPVRVLGWMMFLLLCPIAVRYRWLCGYWYKRDADAP
jgi:glycosyltransferase involved in cell wall biosynthesis